MRRYFNSNPVGCSLAILFVFLILIFNISAANAAAVIEHGKYTTSTYALNACNLNITVSGYPIASSGTAAACGPGTATDQAAWGASGTHVHSFFRNDLNRWERTSNTCSASSEVAFCHVYYIGACVAPEYMNSETGKCEEEELVCDITEALSFYPDDVWTETLLRPQTVEEGTATTNFCASNCEVEHQTTITTVAPEASNNLYVTQSDTYDVVELTCDNINPDSTNFAAADYPEWFPEGEDPNDPDAPDDPDGPDDPDDPDPDPPDDPPPPPPYIPPPPDFCAAYPTHPSCVAEASAGAVCGGPGLPPCNVKLYNNSGTSSAFCTTMPTFTGDRLMGAMLIQEWRAMCASEKAGREIEQEIKQGFDCQNATDGSLCQRITDLGEGLEGEDPGATTFDNSGIGEIPDYETLLQDANDQRVADIGATGTGEFEFTANFNPLTTLMMSVIPQPAACSSIAATYGVEMQIDTCLLGQYRQAMGWGFYVLTMWGIFLIAARKREV